MSTEEKAAVEQGVHTYTGKEGYVPPEDPAVREKLRWFQDRKLGLMIHWGLYCQMGMVASWGLSDEDQEWSRRQVNWTQDPGEFKRQYRNCEPLLLSGAVPAPGVGGHGGGLRLSVPAAHHQAPRRLLPVGHPVDGLQGHRAGLPLPHGALRRPGGGHVPGLPGEGPGHRGVFLQSGLAHPSVPGPGGRRGLYPQRAGLRPRPGAGALAKVCGVHPGAGAGAVRQLRPGGHPLAGRRVGLPGKRPGSAHRRAGSKGPGPAAGAAGGGPHRGRALRKLRDPGDAGAPGTPGHSLGRAA